MSETELDPNHVARAREASLRSLMRSYWGSNLAQLALAKSASIWTFATSCFKTRA